MKISKRILVLSMVGAMTMSACSASNSENGSAADPATEAPAATMGAAPAGEDKAGMAAETAAAAGDSFGDRYDKKEAEYIPADVVEDDADYEMTAATTMAVMSVEMAAEAADEDMEAPDGYDYDEAPEEITTVEVHNQIQAGQLTAGEWNDNENWGFFVNLCNRGLIEYPAYGIDPRFRTAVTVKDESGAPVVNASVSLFDDDKLSWTAVTDKYGKVYLFGQGSILRVSCGGTVRMYKFAGSDAEPVEDIPAETTAALPEEPAVTEHTTFHDRVEILLRDGTAELLGDDIAEKLFGSGKAPEISDPEISPTMKEVEKDIVQGGNAFVSNEVEVVFDGQGKTYPDMQIMFIVDTTGSMDDELMFLQSEFSAIAQKVGTEHAEYSVNFYKDHGDSYVTLTNPFSKDIKDISRQINSEVAMGGGDEPEAVSEILDECMHSQEWRTDTVKLAFLIFDAPPHEDP
ncbi:MAG: carboxypeptidase regulatory-like domain-containing protein [Oscillospiraceae bacterium]|nr:carboxypeptidase regulatory-like domain-containing protein [Oscillospiraceae bacterium]